MNKQTELNDIVIEECGKPLVPYGDYMVPLTDAVTLIMMESGDECPDCFDRAEQIIALVHADERKRMREALLDRDAVAPAAIQLEQMNEQGRFHPIMYWQSAAHAAINTALAAIGLTEEGGAE